MVATVGSVQVAFRADMAAYEASLLRGEKQTDKFERNANRSTQNVGQAFIRLGGLAKTAIGGLLAGVAVGGVTGVVGALRDVARSIADIAVQAKRAGVSTKVFQEWKAVAEQARIPVDSLADGLKELSLRGDRFTMTGKGEGAEAFKRLGYSASELKSKLEDPSKLLLEIIDRLGKFDKAARIRISDEIFGHSAGERFVELIDQGADGISGVIQEAHRLGAVLDDDVISRAIEVDRQFDAISKTVGSALKSAIVDAALALQDFIDRFNLFENQRKSTLSAQLAEIGKERLDIEQRLGELRAGGRAGDGLFGTSFGESTVDDAIRDAERRMEALGAEEAKILAVLDRRDELNKSSRPSDSSWTPPAYTPPAPRAKSGGGSSGRDRSARQAEREAEAVSRLIAELEHELQLVGATGIERETANALRRAGAAATADQQAKIVSLVAALHAEEEATRRATDAADALRDIGRDVLGGIVSDLRAGESAADIFASSLDRVADRLLNMALDGLFSGLGTGGGIFSFIPSVLGFSRGGFTGHGTKNEPAGVVHRGEFVMSKAATDRIGVGNLEAMHRAATKGFADGGYVNDTMSRIVSSAEGMKERSRDTHVTVGVSVDNNGNLQAYVKKVAVDTTAGGISQYDKGSRQRFNNDYRAINTRRVR